jgi:diguanylate cyclase (GGDEF)-like protein/PAS domain S-box-containing protein
LQTLLLPEEIRIEPPAMTGEDETRVLFVDDSNSIRTYYSRLLRQNGYRVEVADSVARAYDMAIEQPFDIAIVDYFMPDENGYVLCQRLRDNPETAHITTAVITGTYLDQVIRDCLDAGAIECMFKNEAEELFLARLASMKRLISVQKSIDQQRDRLAAILESVGEGVYGVDRQGCISFLNPAALQVLGYSSADELIGQYANEIFHYIDADAQHGKDRLFECYQSGEELRNWETKFLHQSGKLIPIDCTLYTLRTTENAEGSVVAFRDISNRKMLEEKLRWQATHDHLTELYNRRYFELRLEREIKETRRSGASNALVYVDLDRFKYVNDTVGHETGDRLLIDISRVLSKRVRSHDVLARIGGDEFAIIIKNVDATAALAQAEDLRLALNKLRVNCNGQCYVVHASMGLAMMDGNSSTAGDVLANADIACHIAKQSGRNRSHLYDKSNDERNVMGTELGWSTRIMDALQNNGFELSYQPIMPMEAIDLDTLPAQNGLLWQRHIKNTSGSFQYEVLVRMQGEGGRMFFPETFIPTAERFNMMTDIDMWVLDRALRDVVATGSPKGKIQLSVNLSGHTLDSDSAQRKIRSIIEAYDVPPGSLVFEITETSAISNLDQANQFMRDLHAIGCRFSLDDFGSGFCSFAQLKNMPTDFVKIDGQFVKSMARGATDRAIVTAMNDVAHSLGRYTVAEYVESAEVVRLLKICGVDKLQGHYISAPLISLPHGNVVRLHSTWRNEDSAG